MKLVKFELINNDVPIFGFDVWSEIELLQFQALIERLKELENSLNNFSIDWNDITFDSVEQLEKCYTFKTIYSVTTETLLNCFEELSTKPVGNFFHIVEQEERIMEQLDNFIEFDVEDE